MKLLKQKEEMLLHLTMHCRGKQRLENLDNTTRKTGKSFAFV